VYWFQGRERRGEEGRGGEGGEGRGGERRGGEVQLPGEGKLCKLVGFLWYTSHGSIKPLISGNPVCQHLILLIMWYSDHEHAGLELHPALC
jgi:hypothetical protein